MENFYRGAKWIFWTILAIVVGVVSYLLYAMFTAPEDRKDGTLTASKGLQEKANKLKEEAQLEKAEAKATAQACREELEKIRKMHNDKKRREKLANFLSTL